MNEELLRELMMRMQLQQLMGLNYRDDVVNAALPARWTNDIVIQPAMSHAGQGFAPPHTGEFRGDTPPLMGIPPSPWNRPNLDPQQGWRSDPNDPVSDEPSGAKYQSGFLSPAQRGFIKAGDGGAGVMPDPVGQLMRQMQLQSLMGGNQTWRF